MSAMVMLFKAHVGHVIAVELPYGRYHGAEAAPWHCHGAGAGLSVPSKVPQHYDRSFMVVPSGMLWICHDISMIALCQCHGSFHGAAMAVDAMKAHRSAMKANEMR